jgi:hypothetical protein
MAIQVQRDRLKDHAELDGRKIDELEVALADRDAELSVARRQLLQLQRLQGGGSAAVAVAAVAAVQQTATPEGVVEDLQLKLDRAEEELKVKEAALAKALRYVECSGKALLSSNKKSKSDALATAPRQRCTA